jgi:hypothetical protein
VFHLVQLLLKLFFSFDRELPDNTKFIGSLFIAGLWLLLLAVLFPVQLSPWRFELTWAGWLLIGLSLILFARRKLLKSRH